MLLLKNLLFTLLVPGTAGVLIPLRIAARPIPAPTVEVWSTVGFVLLAAGAAGYFWCLWEFALTGRGTPAPIDPPRHLAVRGPYRFVRNPMYVSVVSVVLGWAAYLHSTEVFLYAIVLAGAFHLFVVSVEEPTLQRKFGESYTHYRHAVRRWLPTRPS
jgi:protein-S-isoprenylcysteine O-methyltransferase Ste14